MKHPLYVEYNIEAPVDCGQMVLDRVPHAITHIAIVFVHVVLESQSCAFRTEILREGVSVLDMDEVVDLTPAFKLGLGLAKSDAKLCVLHHPWFPHPELENFALKRGGCKVPVFTQNIDSCDPKHFPLLAP